MKIKGQTYNFGRCVRIVFARNTIKDGKVVPNQEEFFTITHAPDINRDWYCAMDITVTDRPSARAKDNPGFQGTVTIYNPGMDLLNVINQGATWVTDYVNENQQEVERANAITRFYASRLTCTISAGYVNDNGEPEYNVILKGFVNGSSLARKGVEDVLTFGVFDIDMMQDSMVADREIAKNYGTEYEIKRILETQNINKFERTWYETLVKYIRLWEMERIPNPSSDYDKTREIKYELSTAPQQNLFPSRKDMSRISEEEKPLQLVNDFDRKRTDWFEVKFVKSLRDWRELQHYAGRDYENRSIGIEGVKLEEDLKTQIMPSNGAIYGNNLAEMLDGLCAVADYRVGWYIDKQNWKRNTYVIYPLGNEPLWVDGKLAGIKIWNYQNLLESPSVSGAGIMTVKMVFNPECKCGITLALMLDKTVKAGDTSVRDLTMSGEIGSLATSASLATFGTVQIGSSNAVAAVNKQAQVGKTRGYMFNIGFPIMSVKHELSTYGKNWTTTVQTVPATAGLNYKQSNEIKKKG